MSLARGCFCEQNNKPNLLIKWYDSDQEVSELNSAFHSVVLNQWPCFWAVFIDCAHFFPDFFDLTAKFITHRFALIKYVWRSCMFASLWLFSPWFLSLWQWQNNQSRLQSVRQSSIPPQRSSWRLYDPQLNGECPLYSYVLLSGGNVWVFWCVERKKGTIELEFHHDIGTNISTIIK